MNERTIITIPLAEVRSTMKARTALQGKLKGSARGTPKGRQVDPQARADIAALLHKAADKSRQKVLYMHLSSRACS